jgi:hypothetical protein
LLVPTPFYHLWLTEDLLQHSDLPAEIHELLEQQRAAFLLGNTAPDVQTISGQPRLATHFFSLPILPGSPYAWQAMLASYPLLAQPDRLPAPQAAFLAGYLCHLQADWYWITDIFAPVFGSGAKWLAFKQRLYLHNVLRAHLDRHIFSDLTPATGDYLSHALPQDWLPFVEDRHLCQWRDWLAEQLCPGCEPQTVTVFAARHGLPEEDFNLLLASEERLEEEIFSHLPRGRLEDYRKRLVAANICLLTSYITGQNVGRRRLFR